ncbi:Nuclear aminoacylation-dependent tRNA export pathway component, variant 3 [Entomophthora muscae]|nr:Nuclear aminoacylation-dependent tRNA export pathway component, variant 3 [Entomophthora muscae]
MLRHPNLLAYRAGVGAVDSGPIYFATERVRPVGRPVNLVASIEEDIQLSKSQHNQLMAWGLYKIAYALRFLNSDCSLVHGMLTLDCVFVNMGLEWKLGGFELLALTTGEESAAFQSNLAQIKAVQDYLPSSSDGIAAGLDAWMFGALMYEAFTGEKFDFSLALPPPSAIPTSLHAVYKRLLQNEERLRLKDMDKVLSNGFFNTTLIKTNEFLVQLAVKEEDEKNTFFSNVIEQAAEFPGPFVLHRLLPQLCTAVEFGAGGTGALGAIMRLADSVSGSDFAEIVVPPLLRSFKSPDRQMRMNLLTHLPKLASHLTPEKVSDELYPSLVSGFQDAAPQLKEATVRGVLCVVDKLKPRLINQDLFGHLQVLQFDAHPAVRTNTLIGMGRIVGHIDASTRESKLIPSLLRSLRDPFPPARRAAVQALGASVQHLEAKSLCNLLLPSIAPLLIDPEKMVREACVATTEASLVKIKSAANSMPDTPSKPAANETKSPSIESDPGWAGWAVSSISKSIVSAAGTISSKAVDSTSKEDPPKPAMAAPQTKAHHQTENMSLNSLRQSSVLDDNDDEDGWDDWEKESISSKKQSPVPRSLSSPKTPTTPKIKVISPPASKSDENSPAKKREEYRRQLEERRKNKASKSPSSPESKAKPARGMALGPKRTSAE